MTLPLNYLPYTYRMSLIVALTVVAFPIVQNVVKKSENSEFVWILEQKKVQASLVFRHQILAT